MGSSLLIEVKHKTDDTGHQLAGVLAVHELHIWRLNQQKSLASAHIVISETAMSSFMAIANTINECLHAYGIHSATLQPEFAPSAELGVSTEGGEGSPGGGLRARNVTTAACMVGCQTSQCEQLSCCD